MSFEEFQNRARLYVIGALEDNESREFEKARAKFGQKAEDFHHRMLSAARSVRTQPATGETSEALKERLMKMVRERKSRATAFARPRS